MFIDARMGGEIAQVYVVKPQSPNDIRAYEQLLCTDEEAAEEPCTAQAIIYNTFMIASVIGDFIKHHAKKQTLPLEGIVKLIDMTSLTLL